MRRLDEARVGYDGPVLRIVEFPKDNQPRELWITPRAQMKEQDGNGQLTTNLKLNQDELHELLLWYEKREGGGVGDFLTTTVLQKIRIALRNIESVRIAEPAE